MRRARTLVLTSLLCVVWWACSEGTGPGTGTNTVGLGIVPSFQIDPALFPAPAVDRVRLTARDVATDEVVGSYDQSVSPTASQWVLSLDIDLGDAASLTIVVEAELFSGTEVVWSGRLGPISVPTSAPALGMDVYRGSLDNLDVTSVTILTAPVVLLEGTSQGATATVSLTPGSTATPVIYWASSDTSVLTVDATGTDVTVTGVSEGTAELIATSGSMYDEVTVQVLAPGTATKTWVGGATTNPTLWSEANNWTPPGAPGAADNVLIPSTANQPDVDVAVSINSLTVNSGGLVDLMQQSFEVVQNLVVDGILTNGEVEVSGTGTFLEGSFDDLRLTADRVASAPIFIDGDLTLEATLSVASENVNVGGDLTTLAPSGRLGMTTPGGSVAVTNATFTGASQDGQLTQGDLFISGDLVASGDPQAFAAGTSHTVVLNGISPQTLDFESAGPAAGRFGTLIVQQSNGVALAGDAFAAALTLNGALTVAAGQTFDVAGTLTLQSGSTLQVDGTVTASDCIDNGGVILGSGTHPCGPVQQFTKVWVGGNVDGPTDWNNAANWSPTGVPTTADTVLVNNTSDTPTLSTTAVIAGITLAGFSVVELNSLTLQVAGNVSAGSSGFQNGTVIVAGTGTVLEGSFDALVVSADRALSGSTWVDTDLQVQGDLDLNGNTLLVYGALTVSTASGRLTMTGSGNVLYVGSGIVFDGGDHSAALTGGQMSIEGDFTVTGSSPTGFVGSGTHVVSFDGTNLQSVTFAAPANDQQRLNDVTISNFQGVSFDSDAFVSGDVQVSGRMEVPAGSTVEITGDLTLYSTSELHVDGTLVVTGTCDDQGALITGTGTQPCGTPSSADYTWVGGATGSVSDWDEPTNWSPVGVPGPADAVLVQGATYSPLLNGDVSVASIEVGGFNSVGLNGYTITVPGDVLATGGGFNTGTVVASGPGNIEGYFDDLEVLGDRVLIGQTYLVGSLTLSADLDVAGQYLQMSNDLVVTGPNGRLLMTDPSSTVYVSGDATFDGADHTNALTEGDLTILGDLAVPASAPLGFVSTGNHQVAFDGFAAQTVNFGAPGASQQRLGRVSTYAPDGVTFVNGAYITGDMQVYQYWVVPSATSVVIDGSITLYGASTFEVNGDVSALNCTTTPGALIFGNGTHPCDAAVAADRIWLGGDATTPSDWGTAANWSPAGVPAANESVVVPSRAFNPVMSFNQSVGELVVGSGASLNLGANTLVVNGNTRALGQISNGVTQQVDDAGGSTVGGTFDDLVLLGTGARSLSAVAFTTGSLSIEAFLDLGQYGLQVGTDLDISGALGGIRMLDPSSYVSVSGNATFDGSSSTGNLVQGVIYVWGDVTVNDTYAPDALHMTGGLLYLLGNSPQTIFMSNPVSDGQVISDLALSGSAKTAASSLYITGDFNASNVTVNGEPGTTVELDGALPIAFLNGVTFDGPSLRITTGEDTDQHRLDNLTFRNQDSAASQLYLEMPMGTVPLEVNAPVFGTPPGSGFYIQTVNPGGADLIVDVTSPTPTTPGNFLNEGANTVINWP